MAVRNVPRYCRHGDVPAMSSNDNAMGSHGNAMAAPCDGAMGVITFHGRS